MARVVVHGQVVDASTNTPVESGRVCLTSGDALVTGGGFEVTGSFLIDTDVADGVYLALVVVGGLDGWRQRVPVAGDAVDVDTGTLRLRPCELSPGVHGQAWDVIADRPAPAGRVSLHRAGRRVASTAIGVDGWFSFDLTCRQPLPPDAYLLVPEIPGYARDPIPLAIVEKLTVYQLGRVDVWSADSTTPTES